MRLAAPGGAARCGKGCAGGSRTFRGAVPATIGRTASEKGLQFCKTRRRTKKAPARPEGAASRKDRNFCNVLIE